MKIRHRSSLRSLEILPWIVRSWKTFFQAGKFSTKTKVHFFHIQATKHKTSQILEFPTKGLQVGRQSAS